MDSFDQALSFSHGVLLSIQRIGGKRPCASIHVLEELRSIGRMRKRLRSTATPSLLPQYFDKVPLLPLPQPRSEKWTLESLCKEALSCVRCPHLAASRTQVVFGAGNPRAELMFIGEAPGVDEDRQGEPFVGRAGLLLTRIIETMGLSRNEVYITNILKCRPDMPPGHAGNRKPKSGEVAACFPWLHEQIAIVRPRVLVALGNTAAEGLLGQQQPMKELRGRWMKYINTPVLVTYHPSYLLRNQSLQEKRKVWGDMLLVLEKLGRPISEKQRSYFPVPAQK
jgi:uracil-DNA glycosylase